MDIREPDQTSLAAAAASHLNLDPGGLSFQRCSTGKYNSTWFIDGAGRPLAIRVAPPDIRERNLFYEHRMMLQEPGIHAAIRKATDVPVPEIVAADFSRELLERDFLLMERIPGAPLSDAPGIGRRELDRLLGEVGQALCKIHGLHAERYGYIGEHEPAPHAGNWTEAFVVMWDFLLTDIETCGGYSSAEASAMRRLLDSHLDNPQRGSRR